MIEKGKASNFIWVKTVNSFENSRSEIIVMAPTKNLKRKEDVFLKERFMFKHAKKGIPDPSFVSLHNCKRNFGFSFTDLSLTEVKEVVWGVRCGQQGYFIPPEVKI